jgi:hypothetical protein
VFVCRKYDDNFTNGKTLSQNKLLTMNDLGQHEGEKLKAFIDGEIRSVDELAGISTLPINIRFTASSILDKTIPLIINQLRYFSENSRPNICIGHICPIHLLYK